MRPWGRDTPPGGPPVSSRHSRYITDKPETFPVTKTGLPIYQSSFPDHSGTPHDVQDLIRDSEQLSVITMHNSNLPRRHRTLSVQTLRVRELCRHDRDTSTANNQQRDLDDHTGSYIAYEDLYRLYLYVKDSVNPVCCSLCSSVCYLLEIRSSVSLY